MLALARRRWQLLALAGATLAGCWSIPFSEVEVDLEAGQPPVSPPAAQRHPTTLRVSLAAMQSPKGTYGAYSRLLDRVGGKMGREIEFVQRRSYREVNDLLVAGETDVAFICTGGYLDLRQRAPGVAEAIAVPVVGGSTMYQSLIIVPASSTAQHPKDLSTKRFAFTDELSFTGHAFPMFLVRSIGMNPERFFSAAIFTHSHDRSVQSVARGLVDGAAVDGRIFDNMTARDPELARAVRVIGQSPPFGGPPVVAHTRLTRETRAALRGALLSLDADPKAALVLRELGIERFVVPTEGLYEAAAVVAEGGR